MGSASDQDGLEWRDGVPVSRRFADPYYALADGLAETRHVFLEGNRLAERWQAGEATRIAELGFGTGLNFLASLALWRAVAPEGARLLYTSFELYPLTAAELAIAFKPWPELDAAPLIAAWPVVKPLDLGDATLSIVVGDARETLPDWQGVADAWFLDGFAPARNPELWSPDLMVEVAAHTSPGGTFGTYTAAGHVRRALSSAGFEVVRQPGFGSKRHMTAGRLAK